MKTLSLPKGKITFRHRQMRGGFQGFAGSLYLPGVSGDTPNDCAEELGKYYDVPSGTTAVVHGYKEPFEMEVGR